MLARRALGLLLRRHRREELPVRMESAHRRRRARPGYREDLLAFRLARREVARILLRGHGSKSSVRDSGRPAGGGAPVKRLSINSTTPVFRWTPDSRAIGYVDQRSLNVWAQPIDGAKPTQLTDFKSDQTFYFDWSRDGKQLALARGTLTSDVVLITDFK
jgi:hypothetical protein